MNMLSEHIRGCHWLDLCSGSGVMGCEALQHGAARVVAVERDARTAAVCRTNLELVATHVDGPASVSVIRQDLLCWLKRGTQDDDHRFSIVYFDPPYEANLYGPVLEMLRLGEWVQSQGLVICEHSSRECLKVPSGWKEIDRRRYGSSSLLILSPPERCHGDTDSRRQRTGPEV